MLFSLLRFLFFAVATDSLNRYGHKCGRHVTVAGYCFSKTFSTENATLWSLRAHACGSCLFAAYTTHIRYIFTILVAVLLFLYRNEALLFFDAFRCKLSHIGKRIVRLSEGRLSDLAKYTDTQETWRSVSQIRYVLTLENY